MSQVELYQSVLTNIGRLSTNQMVELDYFVNQLIANPSISFSKKNGISHLAGAWKTWPDEDFADFLAHTQNVRSELFSDRNIDL
jgi:hypothetical protein